MSVHVVVKQSERARGGGSSERVRGVALLAAIAQLTRLAELPVLGVLGVR